MARSAKLNKLRSEYENLLKLEASSRRRIVIEPTIVQPGRPPESYVVTYKCKGIVNVNAERAPIYDYEHKASIYLTQDYPWRPPEVHMLTPNWHPNIDHVPPHHVCTNEVDTWWIGRHLDDLVMWLGELIQYKHYHAEWVEPFPEDPEVAEWVREYAEPKGIVGPGNPVDETQLMPGWSIINYRRRIKLGTPTPTEGTPDAGAVQPQPLQTAAEVPPADEAAHPERPWRIKLGEQLDGKG